MTVLNRRDRLRAATSSEIKDGARRMLVTGGPHAISLRAIAREMGMTAPAIYRYFPSLEALIGQVAGDIYDELREHIEAARDGAGEEPADQLGAMARAFRCWSVGHPAEFALIFGTPVPGMAALAEERDAADHPAARLGADFIRPLAELWRRSPLATPSRAVLEGRLGSCLEPLRRRGGDLPTEVAYAFLSGWIRLYGVVSMEVFDHLRWAVTDPQALFDTELATFFDQLGAVTGDLGVRSPAGPAAG